MAARPTNKRTPARKTVRKKSPKNRAAGAASAGKSASKPVAAKRGRGRPAEIKEVVVDEICRRIAGGESLEAICKSKGTPDSSTIRRWLAKGDTDAEGSVYAEFRTRYARAREDQADSLADEILDEARAANEKNANAKRVLIDALKWRAGKLKPKVYGSKVEHEHSGPNQGPIPVATADVDLTGMDAAEAAKEYKAFLDATD